MTDEKTILAFASYAYNRGHNDAGFKDAEALAKWAELSGQPAAPAQPVAAQPVVTDEQILAELNGRWYPPKDFGNSLLQRIYPHEAVAAFRALLAKASQ